MPCTCCIVCESDTFFDFFFFLFFSFCGFCALGFASGECISVRLLFFYFNLAEKLGIRF